MSVITFLQKIVIVIATILMLTLSVCLTFMVLDRLYPLDLSRVQKLSRTVVDKNGALLKIQRSSDGQYRLPVRIENVDARFVSFLIAYEDKHFFKHYGVDVGAIMRAIGQLIVQGHIVSGASTLTMQTARLLEPRPRTLISKLIEVFRAIQLERKFSKKDILSMYVTLAPYGGNLEGVRIASLAYFGKEPRTLTDGQAALLVSLPQSPSVRRPDRFPQRAYQARSKVLRRLLASGTISQNTLKDANEERIPTKRYSFPFIAPHLTRNILKSNKQIQVLETTLDKQLQEGLQRFAQGYVQRFYPDTNMAIEVIQTRTGAVRAYIGSSSFFNVKRSGQIDFNRAFRSTGSTLKPLIYAMAFEGNLAHPATIFTDRNQYFGAYHPKNFDRQTYGDVTLDLALRYSLNTPAVAVLQAVSSKAVLKRLNGLGLSPEYQGRKPGLSLALGGVSMSNMQLVNLFTSFANNGYFQKIHVLRSLSKKVFVKVISPKVSHWITGILQKTPRPPTRNFSSYGAIAFKTGTSYGYRDAWAVGYNKDYTVGVWVGRPSGAPSPGLTGINAGAPALFSIFDRLGGGNLSLKRVPLKAPLNLQTLFSFTPKLGQTERQTLRVLFPVNKTKVFYQKGQPITIKLSGGRALYSLFVNDSLVPQVRGRRKNLLWYPQGAGFYTLVVTDSQQEVSQIKIELIQDD